MFEATPWFIGGGAHHSPDVARLLAYAGTAGLEGIIGPADLKVSALATPGGSVEIAAGASVILNRSAGGQQQSYVMRAPSATGLVIAPTGSSARSDLVVIRVEDPQFSPWQAPNDPVAAQYVFPRVIQGVPAGTTDAAALNLGYSAIALARIDLPANTAAVTDAMIKDVRKMLAPRAHREVFAGVGSVENQSLTSSGYVTFPSYGPTVFVPSWATHCTVLATLASVAVIGEGLTDFRGTMRVRLGSLSGPAQDYDFDAASGNYRTTETIVGDFTIPASDRGRNLQLLLQGLRSQGTGHLRSVRGTRLVFDCHFAQRTV